MFSSQPMYVGWKLRSNNIFFRSAWLKARSTSNLARSLSKCVVFWMLFLLYICTLPLYVGRRRTGMNGPTKPVPAPLVEMKDFFPQAYVGRSLLILASGATLAICSRYTSEVHAHDSLWLLRSSRGSDRIFSSLAPICRPPTNMIYLDQSVVLTPFIH